MATQLGTDHEEACSANDPVLRDVLGSATEELRERAISELLASHAYWRIDRILGDRFRRSGIGSDQREDVRAEVLLKLVTRLRRLVEDPEGAPLSRFADYVAVVTFNTFHDYVRRAYPARAKLKNRVLYALRHDRRFAVWSDGDALLCGPAAWAGPRSPFPDVQTLTVLGGTDVRAALADLFAQARGPLEVDAVVSRIAEAQHWRETAPSELAITQPVAGAELERRQSLQRLWNEIGALPPNQRAALLLGARDSDGESVLRLLPVTGIATIRDIAATLLLAAPALAELWHALPLDDNRIAAMLQLTRPQVINLRRSARDRLTRRLRDHVPVRRRQ